MLGESRPAQLRQIGLFESGLDEQSAVYEYYSDATLRGEGIPRAHLRGVELGRREAVCSMWACQSLGTGNEERLRGEVVRDYSSGGLI
ncbi:hypothetical protein HO173_011055 [Letharia columbiana]|uniref:Uncharacterized protein n=1 Tax=Letharia columbiana TaxID=112416 RepID=A0A8H6FLG4_9LECA|nr:uncharacterized protein HO173_011055 [Letharia columbiana]KAF6230703.1 hypothetical protein HO173_011055 [Letharia columbiana]